MQGAAHIMTLDTAINVWFTDTYLKAMYEVKRLRNSFKNLWQISKSH